MLEIAPVVLPRIVDVSSRNRKADDESHQRNVDLDHRPNIFGERVLAPVHLDLA